MITIFNRKELFLTYDLKKQAEIRTLLASHSIKYILNPVKLLEILNARVNFEYRFYVKHADYDFALAVIEKKVR